MLPATLSIQFGLSILSCIVELGLQYRRPRQIYNKDITPHNMVNKCGAYLVNGLTGFCVPVLFAVSQTLVNRACHLHMQTTSHFLANLSRAQEQNTELVPKIGFESLGFGLSFGSLESADISSEARLVCYYW